jgi:hypothetical protein
MYRSMLALALLGISTAFVMATPSARANEECLNQLKEDADRIGLESDYEGGNILVWSPEREVIEPLHESVSGCLRGAYEKEVKGIQGGTTGTYYGTKTANGLDICEVPDLGLMGGHGKHKDDFAIGIHCYHLN